MPAARERERALSLVNVAIAQDQHVLKLRQAELVRLRAFLSVESRRTDALSSREAFLVANLRRLSRQIGTMERERDRLHPSGAANETSGDPE